MCFVPANAVPVITSKNKCVYSYEDIFPKDYAHGLIIIVELSL